MNKWFSESIGNIKKYSSKSVFYKYLKILASILLVPFVILNVVIFSFYTNTSEKEIQNSIKESFAKSTNIFESALSSVQNIHLLCSSDAYTQNYMLMSKPDFSGSKIDIIHNITDMFSYIKTSSNYLDSIYFYSTQSNYVLSSKSSDYLDSFPDRGWYDYYSTHKEQRPFVCQSKTTDNTNILSFGYEMYYSKEVIGIIVLNINLDTLLSLALDTENNMDSTFIYDGNNNLIFASTNATPSFDIQKLNIHNDKVEALNKTTDAYSFAKKIDFLDYTIVSQYDMSSVRTMRIRANFVLLFLIVLSVALAFLIAIYMSFQFYNSISTIMASLSSFGVPIPYEKAENYDEIKFITENILHNSTSKAQMEHELTQKMIYLQKAQTVALQTQFTPHFLFNTLNHISVTLMNIIDKNNPVSQMISILADLLSVALDTKEYTTNIKNEIMYAKKYIELEGIKHKNNFEVIWNVDESLYEYTTPKLILQPILENCFKHGINPLRNIRRGKIEISVQKEKEDIVFCICDNGVGISDEQLYLIRARLARVEIPETRHIGLCNVHQRIQLLFKGDYGCTIYSNNPGVMVKIKLPYKKSTLTRGIKNDKNL